LRTPLLVQQSEERARRLEKLFGKNLEFTPRRRRDVDAIFLATYPQQGRQIKPTLDFLYVGNMPIYATSQIYSGNPAPGIDKDLEGIYFTALPWTLPGPDNTAVTSANSNYASLLAMGVDSYRLHQWLPLLKTMPDVRVEGLTGTLTLAPQNYIHRTLPWARFRNGSVRRISGNHTP
jgi:outer membrane PBP1 activator LpoA protein